jgi:hypothetical protein
MEELRKGFRGAQHEDELKERTASGRHQKNVVRDRQESYYQKVLLRRAAWSFVEASFALVEHLFKFLIGRYVVVLEYTRESPHGVQAIQMFPL